MKHPITSDMLINHIAILAKTGAGKTYGGKGIIEPLLKRGERVCIVDPKNAWWGLKSSADGKAQGFAVVVFGGPNADMPLLASHGKVLGEAIATGNMSCIICTKGMLEGDRIRFLTDFFQALDRKNTEPLHLVLDEAHMMAPQKPLGEMQRLTHWTTELVSGGRGMGFRVILLSQRPARLNKDVLTQCETLVAMRMTGPQDRDAVRNWIHDQADVNKGKEIVASLTGLPNGEGWLWSPELGVLERIKFPKITTYDNSATKRDANADSRAKLAPVNLKDLEAKLGQAAEEIKAHDPVALRRRVVELEQQLKKQVHTDAGKQTVSDHERVRIHDEAFAVGKKDGYQDGYAAGAVALNAEWMKWRAVAEKRFNALIESAMKITGTEPLPAPPIIPEPLNSGRPVAPVRMTTTPPMHTMKPATARALEAIGVEAAKTIRQAVAMAAAEGITRPQQRVIDAIAWWGLAGNDAPTRPQIAGVAGYSPSSGGFNNLIGQMNTSGLVYIPAPGTVSLTDSGRAAAQHQGQPTTGDLHARLEKVLSAPQWKVLSAAIRNWNRDLSREELGAESGYSATSGGFNNLVGELCTLEMLVKPRAGFVKAADWLFL